MNVILLGYPGAGKGTQAQLLKEKGFMHISTGDLIRKEIAAGTALGKQIEGVVKQGSLVSDDIIIQLLMNVVKDAKGGIVFDGFPRTLAQAQTLDKYLALQGKKIDYIVLLKMQEDEVLKRLTSRRVCKVCGAIDNIYWPSYKGICAKDGGELITRPDDTLESAKHRFEVYKKETQPLINYYNKSAGFKEINGSGTPDEVFKLVEQALGLQK